MFNFFQDIVDGMVLTTPESTLRKYPSALRKIHEERGVAFPQELAKRIANYMKGIRKRIANEKKQGMGVWGLAPRSFKLYQ